MRISLKIIRVLALAANKVVRCTTRFVRESFTLAKRRAGGFVANGGLDGTRRREREDAEELARTGGQRARASVVEALLMSEAMHENLREERSIAGSVDFAESVIRALFWWS